MNSATNDKYVQGNLTSEPIVLSVDVRELDLWVDGERPFAITISLPQGEIIASDVTTEVNVEGRVALMVSSLQEW